ncbi:extracellular solute-binding protein [Aliiglaciecola sp. CAU 1673]|uniref:extracellular solute-binding protein n=1 Tax=Aliiglaciecola sp. CAU 1673 TaxID=3032595 RepID=UPI0023DC8B23|nr:extracellular solute-binding protein [Aliiglaciecola sp. CAU 1673]MDF2176892.1 extracellular solute-binding protein [Aliiglaciecola sp. CAU 1673]
MHYVMLLLLIFGSADVYARDSLKVALLSEDPSQIEATQKLAALFEAEHPQIHIQVKSLSSQAYSRSVEDALESGDLDIIYTQTGARLKRLVDEGLIAPLDSMVERTMLEQRIASKSLSRVKYNDFVYALPFAQYPWGFYYNKALFAELGVAIPQTWAEFLTLCASLMESGIKPLVQPNAQQWESLAWFDYLSVLAGDERLHDRLASGPLSDESDLAPLLAAFEPLISQSFFFAPEHHWSWQQSMVLLKRKQAAMVLLGQFAEELPALQQDEEIGYFAFPHAETGTAVVPVGVFAVPTAIPSKVNAGLFLQFIAREDIQRSFALALGWLPMEVNQSQQQVINTRRKAGIEQIASASRHINFFDREAESDWAVILNNALTGAIIKQDIGVLAEGLKGTSTDLSASTFAENQDKQLHFSSIVGHKGTFLVSQLVSEIYTELGYDITVTRFPTIDAALKAQQLGMDGELVRTAAFAAQSEDLLKIPEPLATVDSYLISRSVGCLSDPLPDSVGVASQALYFGQWAKQHHVELVRFDNGYDMRRALQEGKVKGVLLFEPEIAESQETLGNICLRRIETVEFYHYLNKRHQALAGPFNDALKRFKASAEYQRLMQRYGVHTQ